LEGEVSSWRPRVGKVGPASGRSGGLLSCTLLPARRRNGWAECAARRGGGGAERDE